MKKYVVQLSSDERTELELSLRGGRESVRKMKRALILLAAADGDTDEEIAAKVRVHRTTVEHVRKRFADDGLEAALTERPRPGKARMLDGRQEAYILAVACSDPPEGRTRWTLRLLAERLVDLEVVEDISHHTVGRVLKKGILKPWQRKQWCIAAVGPEYVCAMEDVLELLAEPYDSERPVVCFDEKPVQLLSDVREPKPVRAGQQALRDHEYRREGTANIFMMVEPLSGWRHVEVTERRTKLDFAEQMKQLVDVHYPEAATIRLVLDNLNTHRPASLYEAFPPEEALRIRKRLEFHYTPKHGSWLNPAECEISVLERQCLDRRIRDRPTLQAEAKAWEEPRNQERVIINWRFRTQDARIKLWHLYPKLSSESTATED